MIFRIEFTVSAEEDLSNIYDYIAYEQCMPTTAIELVEKIHKEIVSLSYMPERCKKFEHEPWFSKGLRVKYVSSYGIYYTVDMQQGIVRIQHVLSNRVDVVRWLKVN